MKIVVLNGSPKGETSVTMQYVRFIRNRFPENEYRILNVAQAIRGIEADPAIFSELAGEVRSADAVLWAFPLYYFLVHSSLKRFIELVSERDAREIFTGKYTATLSTSIHVFDQNAHRYLEAVSCDLGMHYVGYHSAAMYDLLQEEEQHRLTRFAESFFEAARSRLPVQRMVPPIAGPSIDYRPGPLGETIDPESKKVVIVTDSAAPSTNLGRMTDRLLRTFAGNATLVDLAEVDIRGPCTGCCRCGYDNTCVYNDGFAEFYGDLLGSAEILIFAGTVRDRYWSSLWKRFFDRSFFLGHTPSLARKQFGFIVSGPLAEVSPLREALSVWAEVMESGYLFVTDEVADSAEMDRLLDAAVGRLIRNAEAGYLPTPTFYHAGAGTIMRDQIYGPLRLPFQADYRFYRENGRFDFPQRDLRTRLWNAVMIPLTRIPTVKRKAIDEIKYRLVEPFERVVGSA